MLEIWNISVEALNNLNFQKFIRFGYVTTYEIFRSFPVWKFQQKGSRKFFRKSIKAKRIILYKWFKFSSDVEKKDVTFLKNITYIVYDYL
jgi:hypothetical protein